MKTKLSLLLVAGLALLGLNAMGQTKPATNSPGGTTDKADANASSMTSTNEEPEGINFRDAPAAEVIDAFARDAKLRIYIDPKIRAFTVGADGKENFTYKVTLNWPAGDMDPGQAFQALIDNLGFVTTTNSGVVRISAKDPNVVEPLQYRLFPLQYAITTAGTNSTLVTNLVSIIKAGFSNPRSQVQFDPRTFTLVLVATESEINMVTNVIARLDGSVPQILIESKFIETLKNPKSVKGIDWTGTLQAQNFSFGNGYTSSSSTSTGSSGTSTGSTPGGHALPTAGNSGFSDIISSSSSLQGSSSPSSFPGLSANTLRGFNPATAFLNADGVKAVLSFLNTENDSESIAEPRAVVMAGRPAELSVVRNIPVFEEQQGAAAGGIQQASTVKPNYDLKAGSSVTPLNQVGITLIVTPRVVGSNYVQMDLQPEISAKEVEPERLTLGGKVNESPIFSRTRLSTIATVPNGNTLVIGGLLNDATTKNYTKVPLLGDIPILGYAFRKDSKERNKRNIFIFVTPTIVREEDYQSSANSGANFLKSKPKENLDIETPAWDTGKPKDATRTMF